MKSLNPNPVQRTRHNARKRKPHAQKARPLPLPSTPFRIKPTKHRHASTNRYQSPRRARRERDAVKPPVEKRGHGGDEDADDLVELDGRESETGVREDDVENHAQSEGEDVEGVDAFGDEEGDAGAGDEVEEQEGDGEVEGGEGDLAAAEGGGGEDLLVDEDLEGGVSGCLDVFVMRSGDGRGDSSYDPSGREAVDCDCNAQLHAHAQEDLLRRWSRQLSISSSRFWILRFFLIFLQQERLRLLNRQLKALGSFTIFNSHLVLFLLSEIRI